MLKVRGKALNVDILEELSQFEWRKQKIRDIKWIACSPFRPDENNPSFAVNLENGVYIDSALSDDYWRAGAFQKLLSFLLGCTVEEAEDFLLEKYSPFYKNVSELELKLKLSLTPSKKVTYLNRDLLNKYNYENKYLQNERGIKKEILQQFNVGFDPNNNCSVFIWKDKVGRPVNVKFRKNDSKKFFYLKKASPIKNHIYLLHDIYKNKPHTGYITESEIDALYLRSVGEYPAVALGGASLSAEQEKLLLSAPVKKWVTCTDNDEVGERIASLLSNKLNGYKGIEKIKLPFGIKDVNELPMDCLLKVLEDRTPVGFRFLV